MKILSILLYIPLFLINYTSAYSFSGCYSGKLTNPTFINIYKNQQITNCDKACSNNLYFALLFTGNTLAYSCYCLNSNNNLQQVNQNKYCLVSRGYLAHTRGIISLFRTNLQITTTTNPTTTNLTTTNPTTTNLTTTNPTTTNLTTTTLCTLRPTTSKPTTNFPTTSKPTTSKPTTNFPTTSKPTTNFPTTSKPTMINFVKKVIYINARGFNWNDPGLTVMKAVDAGFNVIILTFWMSGKAVDSLGVWQSLSVLRKRAVMEYVHSKGALVLASAGGSTDAPYLSMSGSLYGLGIANFVINNYLDGIDFDLENFSNGFIYKSLTTNQTITWLIDMTRAAKNRLNLMGVPSIITHAPQSPYFGKIGSSVENSFTGKNGGYSALERACGSIIDWYNVQFYSQGSNCYLSYTSLFEKSFVSGCFFQGTSVMEIVSYGIPLRKMVVGKPLLSKDASNGYVAHKSLGIFFTEAYNKHKWNSGVMFWQWDESLSTKIWPALNLTII